MFNKRKSSSDNQASKAQPGHFREAGEGEESGSSARKLSLVTAASVAIAVIAVVYAFLTSSNVQSEIATCARTPRPLSSPRRRLSRGRPSPRICLQGRRHTCFVLELGGNRRHAGSGRENRLVQYSRQQPGYVGHALRHGQCRHFGLPSRNVAISIAVDSESGLSGLIKQNDYVDILGNGEVIVQNVRVAALDSNLSGSVSQYATVTLEVAHAGDDPRSPVRESPSVRFEACGRTHRAGGVGDAR